MSHVVQKSGMGLVDQAAVQSAQTAHYPAPPAELKGVDNDYEVWFEYRP